MLEDRWPWEDSFRVREATRHGCEMLDKSAPEGLQLAKAAGRSTRNKTGVLFVLTLAHSMSLYRSFS